MAICDSCKRLAATPKRAAVPAHLSRIEPGSAAGSQRAEYRCRSCDSRWQWIAPATWVLRLPPLPAGRGPGEAKPGWWTMLGRWFGGARADPRGPIELRAPRLASRRRAPAVYPVVRPGADAEPPATGGVPPRGDDARS